jgi:D-alanyl-D-alanine carboxypeptidase (penicillin-binding protein 5/6)
MQNEAASRSTSDKKHSSTAQVKTTGTSRVISRKTPLPKTKSTVQRAQSNRRVSRIAKRSRSHASHPQPNFPLDRSFSEASPPLPPTRTFAAALLADARTGQVLFSLNDHREWPAASLTKMMVALLTLEAIDRGEVSLRTPVEISKRASAAGGRSIHLRPGEIFPLEELLQAMMVTSANDAAVALAEHLKGSVEACVVAMNQRARQLGMYNTVYQTPNGLPLNDGTPPDISTATDLALLGRTLARHPLLLQWTSLNRIPFREGRTFLPNTNHLVGRVPGVDGLKTGFTAKARFNLVTTAQRGPIRLIAVVLGGQSSNLRFHTAANLLEWGFIHFAPLNVTESEKSLGTNIKNDKRSFSTMQAPLTINAASTIQRHDHIVSVIPTTIPLDLLRIRWFPVHN